MRAEFDQRWTQLAQEVMSGLRAWQVQHPTATMTEIEEELVCWLRAPCHAR